MKQSLRDFLRDRAGLSEEQLDKIEQRAASDERGALRKGGEDDAAPAMVMARACEFMLDEIRGSIDRILKADALRGAAARGAEEFTSGRMNGIEHAIAKGAGT
jgi:hypothetical protein